MSRRGRFQVAVLETAPQLREPVERFATALARNHGLAVYVCPWQCVVLDDENRVLLHEAVAVSERGLEVERFAPLLPLDALLFDAGSRALGPPTPDEHLAVAQLATRGLITRGADRRSVVLQVLEQAEHRGLITNRTGAERVFGPKDELEQILDAYTTATGRTVSRPETVVAEADEVIDIVAGFAARDVDCMVKPVDGSRGRGIEIVAAKNRIDQFRWNEGRAVVQALVLDPCLADGRKFDLRVHTVIDTDGSSSSGLAGPVLARWSGAPYQRALPQAENTNATFQIASGLEWTMLPVNALPIPPAEAAAITRGTSSLAQQLVDAHRWWSSTLADHTSGRVLFWAFDAVAARVGSGIEVSLVENNVAPMIFHGQAKSDAASADSVTHFGGALVERLRSRQVSTTC